MIQIQKGKVDLVFRNGISFNAKYKDLMEAFTIFKEVMILDGEIVVEDKKGNSKFHWPQYYQDNPDRGKVKCYVFDILYFNGFDLTGLESLQRKKNLEALIPKSDTIIYSKHSIGKGTTALKEIQKSNGEGLIAKKGTSYYFVNKRSKDWLKIKVSKGQEMIVGGYTDPRVQGMGLVHYCLGILKEIN